MNPNLHKLQPYPFQKLRELFSGASPAEAFSRIDLSIGEPKHATPPFIQQALTANLAGLAHYPTTQGKETLLECIAKWLMQRYHLPDLDPAAHIVPLNGSREGLFAFAQAVVDASDKDAIVVSTNPFYQIYEGAALLAGARPYFLNKLAQHNYRADLGSVPEAVWRSTQLFYICSPDNPTGSVVTLEDWKTLFNLSERFNFIIAADECYSEIYTDESTPPLGALQAAQTLGLKNFARLIVFSSLSKRSNVPGMRSGFAAGDPDIISKFLLYRTYHGCAMNPAVQAASIAAWNDEAHVIENRALYRAKFETVTPILQQCAQVTPPDAGFYLWMQTPVSDTEFAKLLFTNYHVVALPGSYLAREAHGVNPGENFVRLALVPSLTDCLEAAQRIKKCIEKFP